MFNKEKKESKISVTLATIVIGGHSSHQDRSIDVNCPGTYPFQNEISGSTSVLISQARVRKAWGLGAVVLLCERLYDNVSVLLYVGWPLTWQECVYVPDAERGWCRLHQNLQSRWVISLHITSLAFYTNIFEFYIFIQLSSRSVYYICQLLCKSIRKTAAI